MDTTDILVGLPAAAAVAAALAVGLARPWRRAITGNAGDWSAATAMSAGYICGHTVIFRAPAMLPTEGQDALVHAAVVGLIVGIAITVPRVPPIVRAVALILAGAGLAAVCLRWKLAAGQWSAAQAAAWLAGLGLAAYLAVMVQSYVARRSGALSSVLVWLMLLLGTTGLVHFGGFAKLAILAAVVVTVLAVLLVVVGASPRFAVGPASATVVTLLWAGLLTNGYFLAEIPTFAAIVLAATPVAGLLGTLPWSLRRPFAGRALAVIAVGMAAGAAVWITQAAAPEPYY